MVDDKQLLRAGLLRARAALTPEALAAAAIEIAAHADDIAVAGRLVAAYAGVGTEPPTRQLLEALAACGARVLLPVVAGDDLDWAEFTSWADLGRSERGLLEPAGPRHGRLAAGRADVVLVPALAVDRRGTRLGRGAGYYDRWLADVDTRVIGVVYDTELVDVLPREPHDRPVDAALTPQRGVVALGQ